LASLRNSRLALFLSLGAIGTASGCADYLNHRDSVTLAGGDAVHFNQAVHSVEHLPREAYATPIHSDGKRIAVVYEQYWKRPPPPQPVVNVNIDTSD
jgi:hypothetical protein